MSKEIKNGVMLLVKNEDGRVLMGKRRNAFCAGQFSIPAGHVEVGETFTEAAVRELKEETGIEIKSQDLELFSVSNYVEPDWESQYITYDFLIQVKNDVKVQTPELHKCEGWEWHETYKLPEPIHYPAARTIVQYYMHLLAQEIILT